MTTRPSRRRLVRQVGAVAMAVLSGSAALSSCTSSEDQFCGRLRDDYRLDDLVTAIQKHDQRRITESLGTLRDLQDIAPDEVHDDFRTIVDAVNGAVRAVTNAPGPDGEEVPVDLTLLRQQLAEIQEPAQHVADFADRSCGLSLNP